MTQFFNSSSQSFDFIVVGVGVYGICIAYYLCKQPGVSVLLIEQFQIGH